MSPVKTTVKEYLAQWLPKHTQQLSDKTKENYKKMIENHITPNIGTIPIQKLNAGQIENMYTALGDSKRKSPLSPKSIHYVHAVLNASLKAAVRLRLLSANPCNHVKLPERKSTFEGTIIPPDQVGLYLDALKGTWVYPAVIISITCGLRRGELLGLKWSDINLKTRKLTVNRSAYRVGSEMHEKPPKNGKTRSVYISTALGDLLRQHKKERRHHRLLYGPEYIPSDYVVVYDDGRRPRPDGLSRFFRRRIKAAKLPHVRFHDLRHTAASLMILGGNDIKTVSDTLGHSSISITADIYAHTIDEARKQLADSMDKYLKNQ
ncbi:MAG: site-specific integrase [Desulfobacterales bacterium]|nr:site-specific integrase [Desulfobacterales bacterium]